MSSDLATQAQAWTEKFNSLKDRQLDATAAYRQLYSEMRASKCKDYADTRFAPISIQLDFMQTICAGNIIKPVTRYSHLTCDGPLKRYKSAVDELSALLKRIDAHLTNTSGGLGSEGFISQQECPLCEGFDPEPSTNDDDSPVCTWRGWKSESRADTSGGEGWTRTPSSASTGTLSFTPYTPTSSTVRRPST